MRFVTFNILHGGPLAWLRGDATQLERRLEIAIEELKRLQPDVIGLQEASDSRGAGNVAARVAEALGFFHAYAPANPRPVEHEWINRGLALLLGFSEGPAIVSRFPITASRVQRLPRCGRGTESRSLLSATLRTPWGDVQAFSTHTMGDVCQTQPVAKIVAADGRPFPGVLMGDFNAVETAPAVAPLNGGFTDAFRAANGHAPGPTVWQRIGVPQPTVSRRVDYVFLVPGRGFPGRVVSSHVVLNTPKRTENGDRLWPSDHYGVLAVLELFPAPAAVASRPRT